MNKTIKRILLLGILLSIFYMSISYSNALPNSLNIQGRLLNSSSSAITGTYPINFSLYDAPAGGTMYYSKNKTVAVDSSGVYDVLLEGINLPFDIDYYLGITYGGDAEATPRVNISNMPYAFRANYAENLTCTNCITDKQINELNLSSTLNKTLLIPCGNITGAVSNLCTITPSGVLPNTAYTNESNLFTLEQIINNNLNVTKLIYVNESSCGKLFTNANGVVSCGVDATGATSYINLAWVNQSNTFTLAQKITNDLNVTQAIYTNLSSCYINSNANGMLTCGATPILTESDPLFIGENVSLWNEAKDKSNITYQNLISMVYNHTTIANAYTDSVASGNNASWLSTFNATYNALIPYGVNDTLVTVALYNADWNSTANETYKNILNQQCPAGNYTYQIQANGTILCRNDLTGSGLTSWSSNLPWLNESNLFILNNTFNGNVTILGGINISKYIYTNISSCGLLNTTSTGMIACGGTPIFTETDPQVGTLTTGKWCIENGGVIDCTQNQPLLSLGDNILFANDTLRINTTMINNEQVTNVKIANNTINASNKILANSITDKQVNMNNISRASIGNCSGSTLLQNITTYGIECIAPAVGLTSLGENISFINQSNTFILNQIFNGNISVIGNITADKFIGNGSLLTEIPVSNETQLITDNNASWLSTYNATYDAYKTNVSINYTTETYNIYNTMWNSTYNATYAGLINNASYLSTYNATYNALIPYGVNDTLVTVAMFNADWNSTYNATYAANLYNYTLETVGLYNASWISTYNATYDAYKTNVSINYTTETFNLYNTMWNRTGLTSLGDNILFANDTLRINTTMLNNEQVTNVKIANNTINASNKILANSITDKQVNMINLSRGSIGNCSGSTLLQNITTYGIECIAPAVGLTNYGSTLFGNSTSIINYTHILDGTLNNKVTIVWANITTRPDTFAYKNETNLYSNIPWINQSNTFTSAQKISNDLFVTGNAVGNITLGNSRDSIIQTHGNITWTDGTNTINAGIDANGNFIIRR